MGNNCNSYLFAGESLTLIDPGHIRNEFSEPCLERLLNSMKSDGFEVGDVELIILTHSHPDHCEAASAINKGKARIALYRDRDDGKHTKVIQEQMYRLFGLEPVQLEPDSFLEDGNVLHLDGVDLTVLHTPGHAPDSISLYWAQEKVLLTGDVVFSGSIGRTDFPGGGIHILQQSIERLSELDVEYLLPGHMDIVSGRDNVQRNFAMVKKIFFGAQ